MGQVNSSPNPGTGSARQSPQYPGGFDRVHEKTLLGAIDSYMSALVHVRPYLAHGHRQVLEALAEQWLDEEGANAVSAIPKAWLDGYIGKHAERVPAIRDFYAWAGRENLLDDSQS